MASDGAARKRDLSKLRTVKNKDRTCAVVNRRHNERLERTANQLQS